MFFGANAVHFAQRRVHDVGKMHWPGGFQERQTAAPEQRSNLRRGFQPEANQLGPVHKGNFCFLQLDVFEHGGELLLKFAILGNQRCLAGQYLIGSALRIEPASNGFDRLGGIVPYAGQLMKICLW